MSGTRDTRRRRMHERQAVIFGVMLAVLAVTGLVGAAVYSGAVSLPFFSRAFSTATPVAAVVPCPPDATLPLAASSVTVDVLNGSSRQGLAATTAQQLQSVGFVVSQTSNATNSMEGAGEIVFGPNGVAAAYTLLPYVTNATLDFERTRTSATVDIVLGSKFTALTTDNIDSSVPLVGVHGCVPLSTLTATPEPDDTDGSTAQATG